MLGCGQPGGPLWDMTQAYGLGLAAEELNQRTRRQAPRRAARTGQQRWWWGVRRRTGNVMISVGTALAGAAPVEL